MIENNNTVITTQRTIYDRAKDLLPEAIALLTGSVTAIGVGILIFGTSSAAPLIFGVLLSDTVASIILIMQRVFTQQKPPEQNQVIESSPKLIGKVGYMFDNDNDQQSKYLLSVLKEKFPSIEFVKSNPKLSTNIFICCLSTSRFYPAVNKDKLNEFLKSETKRIVLVARNIIYGSEYTNECYNEDREKGISDILSFAVYGNKFKFDDNDNYNEKQLKILTDEHFNEKSLNPFQTL